MSTNHTTVGGEVQQSLDRRLDTIDRALLGLLPRHERTQLVAQIETKLREFAEANPPLGAQPGEATPDRSDRSDRSDRFDEVEAAERSAAIRPAGQIRRSPARRGPRSRLAVSSGILGIVALALLAALPFVYFVTAMLGDEWITMSLLGGHLTALALGGLAAVVLGIVALVVLNRHDGRLVGHGWAITGLCTGPMPMLVGGLVALVVGVELLGTISPGIAYTAVAPPSYSTAPPGTQAPGSLSPMVGQPTVSYVPEGASLASPAAPACAEGAACGYPPPDAMPASPARPVYVEAATNPASVVPATPMSSPEGFDPYADPSVSAPARLASPPTTIVGEPQPEAPEQTNGPPSVR